MCAGEASAADEPWYRPQCVHGPGLVRPHRPLRHHRQGRHLPHPGSTAQRRASLHHLHGAVPCRSTAGTWMWETFCGSLQLSLGRCSTSSPCLPRVSREYVVLLEMPSHAECLSLRPNERLSMSQRCQEWCLNLTKKDECLWAGVCVSLGDGAEGGRGEGGVERVGEAGVGGRCGAGTGTGRRSGGRSAAELLEVGEAALGPATPRRHVPPPPPTAPPTLPFNPGNSRVAGVNRTGYGGGWWCRPCR